MPHAIEQRTAHSRSVGPHTKALPKTLSSPRYLPAALDSISPSRKKQNLAEAKEGATATWLDARLASSACHRPTPLCQLVNQVKALSEMPSSLPWWWRALEEQSQLDQGAVGLVGEDMTRMGIE